MATKLMSQSKPNKYGKIEIERHVPRYLVSFFKGQGWKTSKVKREVNIMKRQFTL